MTNLLEKINSPEDIKNLAEEELSMLADETRKFIIKNVDITGGHLAPSLGVVELTIALLKVFSPPKDKIVWDVGHQAYAYKIYTGRRDVFHTNRQYKGISGFIKPSESVYDTFGVGHASTSISAGFGFVMARELNNDDCNVISVIGDGSITGGLAFEGLNNAGVSGKNFLVILNDNEMSISKNVGAISKYTTSVLSDPTFNKFRNDIWNLSGKYKLGKQIRKGFSKLEDSVKSLLTPGILFEKLGFNYIGPVNGHDIPALVKVLENIKNKVSGPVFLHIITEKGKGYKPAEEDIKGTYHGVNPGILEAQKEAKIENPKYQDVFGKALCSIAEKDKKIVAVTAAMKIGTGLSEFADRFPERFFDVGIAEEHAVTFSAALSINGFKPVVAIYSTFLQRSYDQIIHDCALQKLDMIFAIDRSGIVGEDGPTHHGVFDISYLRIIPNIIIMSPRNGIQLRNMLYTASRTKGIFAIRYPRGSVPKGITDDEMKLIEIGKGEQLVKGTKAAVLCIGNVTNSALKAAEILNKKGIDISLYDMKFPKPLDAQILNEVASGYNKIITIEENSLNGGFGSAVIEYYNSIGKNDIAVHRLGIPDEFVEHGNTDILLGNLKLNIEGIAQSIAAMLKN
ncbi:MAG TPA: 1-deoxy-D-xylulose-5-phosphate synthase [Clostridiales bacterium]|nr:1-deoxy-D-xylulose-5-phosphate synthase [Clostridiales bacterium]HQP69673.1 1-deoxy-D-xylulose-5-phosphate synthase [Clostridiales bacterium]